MDKSIVGGRTGHENEAEERKRFHFATGKSGRFVQELQIIKDSN